MKKTKYLLRPVLVGLVLIPIVGSVAWAATSTSASIGPLTAPSDPEQSTTLPQRIAQRKSALKTQLTSVQSQNISKKCSVAQTSLQDIKTKDKAKANSRTQTYTDLATQLNTVIDRLDRQSVNTANLKIVQTKFNNSINQYLTDSVAYKTALDDVVVMDCSSDATGFEATLTDARQLRSQLSKDIAQIKSLLPDLTKVLLDSKDALVKSMAKNGASQ